MKYFLKAFRNYAKFSGRAGRQEFWNFFGVHFLVTLFVNYSSKIKQLGPETLTTPLETLSTVCLIYLLVAFIPLLSVSVRRLHDLNRTGWWVLLHLLQPVGSLVLLVMLAGGSSPDENKYGPAQPGDSSTDAWPRTKLVIYVLVTIVLPLFIGILAVLVAFGPA